MSSCIGQNEARGSGTSLTAFETATAAVRRNLDMEGLGDRTGLHLEIAVDTLGSDDEAFGHLDSTGAVRSTSSSANAGRIVP